MLRNLGVTGIDGGLHKHYVSEINAKSLGTPNQMCIHGYMTLRNTYYKYPKLIHLLSVIVYLWSFSVYPSITDIAAEVPIFVGTQPSYALYNNFHCSYKTYSRIPNTGVN